MNIIPTIQSVLEQEGWQIPMKEKSKEKRLNPKTNRVKTFKNTRYLDTDIPPEQRTMKNLPRYSDKTPKVRFQDWLLIKGEKREDSHTVQTFGKSEADGKWYGWSHRAVYGFGIGDKITKGAVNYKGKEYTIKSEAEARQAAIDFAEGVS